MSHLVAASRPIAGAHVVKRYPGHGILGADVPTTGDNGGSPALNDGIDPAKRYAWRVVTPTGGTLTIYPDLSFDLVQGVAPDGSYPWTYRLLEDGQDAGTAVVSSTFGTTAVSLTATSISTQPVTLGSPALAQTHALSATAISTRPVLGTPVLTQVAPGAIVALGITTSPVVLGTPSLSQQHALMANGIAASAPVLGMPVLTEGGPGEIVALNITTAPVAIGSPELSQTHVLSAGAIAAGPPIFGTPILASGLVDSLLPGPASYRVVAQRRVWIVKPNRRGFSMLPSKDPEEIKTITFDFTADADLILAAEVTASSSGGRLDASPNAVVGPEQTIDGALVYRRVKSGQVGSTYALRCKAIDADGEVHILAAALPVAVAAAL